LAVFSHGSEYDSDQSMEGMTNSHISIHSLTLFDF